MEKEHFLEIGKAIGSAQQSQMFGKSCFKINGKAFICFFQNAIVCKLFGTQREAALALPDSKLFDPSGKNKPMKAWVQIPYEQKEVWKHFAQEASDYVSGAIQ